ncbi:MAG: hypothetical protein HWE14_14560 [Flavobacteriia bacterium]|nr:hypothetical protein [Flavobacteriia bacterium]
MNRPQPPFRPNPKKARRDKRELPIGLIVAILTPVFGSAILLEIYPNIDLEKLDNYSLNTLIVRLLTFAVLVNAGLFFFSLRLNREGLGRGVLMGTLIVAIAIIYFKFLA